MTGTHWRNGSVVNRTLVDGFTGFTYVGSLALTQMVGTLIPFDTIDPIILAGTIVGSGELLLTTSLGAKHGFVFLLLILFSCVIKVFIQVEPGRYVISSDKATLGAINELSGPRPGAHWIAWWWLIMMISTVFQLGAMTGTVGQALL
ncbi:MAG: hypothetical protein WKF77_24895, partial [Planctomycetaceae bacterium]